MNWKVLEAEQDYSAALSRTIDIFHALPGTPEGDELEVLLLLVSTYESKHFPLPTIDAIEVIKQNMEQRGL